MKKSDLKNFDVVQLRNGEKYIFADGVDVIFNKKYTLSLRFYDENLAHHKVKSEDIVAVRRTTNDYDWIPDDLTTAPMIWEREEKIELTQFERLLLEHILNKGYIFVARDLDNDLCFFGSKPFKFSDRFWDNDDNHYVKIPTFLNDVFQFVKWEQEEAMSIKELLKNE